MNQQLKDELLEALRIGSAFGCRSICSMPSEEAENLGFYDFQEKIRAAIAKLEAVKPN